MVGMPRYTGNAASDTPGAPPCRVLVVDDNVDAAQSLAMLLEVMGCMTETAYDGWQALDRAASFRPDVVLLDIGMPRLDGHETCRRLRAEPWGSSMTIVALTGWDRQHEAECSGDGQFDPRFDHHLLKPTDLQALSDLFASLPACAGVSGPSS